MESATTEEAPVAVVAYRRRPTTLETQEKNDRDRNTRNTGNSLRVHSSRRLIPGKNLDANQSD